MRVLVTGGSGFLGKALVFQLLSAGHEVVTLCRGRDEDLERSDANNVRGDLADQDTVREAARGCDAVIHTAAKVGAHVRAAEFESTNVLGTRHVINACLAEQVGRLIYTSTPSVVHAGGDIEGADESLPYPDSFHAHYPRTKAAAERAVLAANGDQLATVALRPHLIWGPGDTNLVPRILARARAGRLRFVGTTPKLVDTTYIDNAVDAHLCALRQLEPGAACAGKAYFIANGEPVLQSSIINGILEAGGLPPNDQFISATAARIVGGVLEAAYWLFGLRGEPPMTRFLAEQLSTAHWYDLSAAARELEYRPRVSVEEGLRRLAISLRSDAKPRAHEV
jgi:2-alkyl-3-oxoalkanoate reductase